MKKFRLVFLVISAILLVSSNFPITGVLYFNQRAKAATTVSLSKTIVPHADDFSTSTFSDGLDMSDFSDIAQYLNGGGRVVSLTNINVSGSVFSATSLLSASDGGPSMFHVLFPGYEGAINVGKNIGEDHPINPNQYACAYIAMKVNSPNFDPYGTDPPDHFLVGWDAGVPNVSYYGNTYTYLYPETLSGTPVTPRYKLYKVNLANPENGIYSGSTPWLNYSSWRGLRIHPTIFKNINFYVDWIRLTSCQDSPTYQVNLTWSPNSSISSVWVRPEGTTRQIQVATGISGSTGAYTLDTKGLPPGKYQIGLGTLTNCCTEWSASTLEINQPPIAEFISPAPSNGEDYALSAGNAWDIGPEDVDSIRCTSWSFSNGTLFLDTLYPAALSSNCIGGVGEADPGIYLHLPAPLINPAQYRYLSIDHRIDGQWALPADGMIGRYLWTTVDGCTYVSRHFVYEIGWHEYTIDLHDAFQGTPVESAPASCGLKPWKDAGQITYFRFDPNENYTGRVVSSMIFHQEIDWIKLTKQDQVIVGDPYTVRISANKPSQEISVQYYYTNNPSLPTQNLARVYQPNSPNIPTDTFKLYLPLTVNSSSSTADATTFQWDTSSVAPGEYYLCVRVQDQLNAYVKCSQSPVKVSAR